MIMFKNKLALPTREEALPGRFTPMKVTNRHFVNQHPLCPPYPEQMELAMFGMGCFWGAEKQFWETSGVYTTAVGYAGGHTPNPTYEEVCSGRTGHNEVVQVCYDPAHIDYSELLRIFWEAHNPTQGMQQGNDIGTQYRSGIYVSDDLQREKALESQKRYQQNLINAGYPEITTEILAAPVFYFAEDYHQQYLAKNPRGYCGLGGTGVVCA
ncbi:MAG: peptide-methionine (S)-S-oxide reductase MsrA [Gammaproteobacteria bacterium]|nr:peptide-methionine (S)-S-oxide reductase MsrA [Gammaproteobacteria bacterium]